MYHRIEFVVDHQFGLARWPGYPPERMAIWRGSRLHAWLRPYVIEAADGPAEVADMFFADGSAARQVPFACFAFVE